MWGRHPEVGKVELGPYIRGKEDSCPEKEDSSPVNSSAQLKNQPGKVSRCSGST